MVVHLSTSESHLVNQQHGQTNISKTQIRQNQFEADSLASNQPEESTASTIWGWISAPFIWFWEWATWLICCCPSESNETSASALQKPSDASKITLDNIVKSPEAQAKLFAEKPNEYIDQLLDNFMENLDQFQEIKKGNANAFAPFIDKSAETLGQEKLGDLLFGNNPVLRDALLSYIGKKDPTDLEKGALAKYNELGQLVIGSAAASTNACNKLSTILNDTTSETPEGRERLKFLKEFVSDFIPGIGDIIVANHQTLLPIFMEFKNPSNRTPEKMKEIIEIFLSDAIVKNTPEEIKATKFLGELNQDKLLILNQFFNLQSALEFQNFDLDYDGILEIFTVAFLEKIRDQLIPQLLNFIGDDHPLATLVLNKAEKLLAKSASDLWKFGKKLQELGIILPA